MFFFLSKIFWALAAPLNFCTLALGIGTACVRVESRLTFRRAGWGLILCVLGFLILFGVFPLGQNLLTVLETRYPPLSTPPPRVDGIILLGGAVETTLPRPHSIPQLNDHADRIVEFVRLARLYPHARLVFTGGTADIAQAGAREADLLPPLLTLLGVSSERMIYESKSRNTYENAMFSKEIVHPEPEEVWILVTSGFHMPRSMAVFQSAGWRVVAAPADFKTDGRIHFFPDRFDVAGNLSDFSTALREIIGIAAYAASGKISWEKTAP